MGVNKHYSQNMLFFFNPVNSELYKHNIETQNQYSLFLTKWMKFHNQITYRANHFHKDRNVLPFNFFVHINKGSCLGDCMLISGDKVED